MREIEERRRVVREASWILPSELARRLVDDPHHAAHITDFKNVLVVNISKLGEAIDLIDAAFARMAASLKEEPLVRW